MRGSKTEISPGVWRLRVFTGQRRRNGSPILVSRTVHATQRRAGAGARIADSELAKLVAQVEAGQVRAGSATVGEVLDQWLEHCEVVGRSPTTVAKYRQIADSVVRPELGSIKLSKLTARHLDRLYAKLTAKGNKATTVRRVHALISVALTQARKWQLVASNVARDASPPSIDPVPVEAPDADAVRAMIAAAEKVEPALAALLFLAAATGARRGELCALRWSDIDWELGALTIARSVYEAKGGSWAEKDTKSHQVRRVGLDDLAMTVLRRYRSDVDQIAAGLDLTVPEDAFMFSRSPQGTEPIRPDVVSKFTARVAKKAGLDTHLHALRHFSATQLIAGGHDIRTVAGRLGHRDPSITLRVYSHVLPEKDREAAQALGRILALPTGRSRKLVKPKKTG